jgi:hypothetical protein
MGAGAGSFVYPCSQGCLILESVCCPGIVWEESVVQIYIYLAKGEIMSEEREPLNHLALDVAHIAAGLIPWVGVSDMPPRCSPGGVVALQ